MNARRSVLLAVVGATALATAFAPAAAAAPKAKKKVTPDFSITKLSITNYNKTVDVKSGPRTVKFQVQVKDKSKKFDPATVRLAVTEKVTGGESSTITVKTHRVGKSKVVTNWRGKLIIPTPEIAPGASATYCVKLVKVDDTSSATLPVVKSAKGLSGRDCFTAINSTPVAPPA